MLINEQDIKIAVIGLGYVGLPVAMAFAKHFNVLGFDVDQERVQTLNDKLDLNGEFSTEQLQEVSKLTFSDKEEDLGEYNVYIVTVPTPIDSNRNPDLTAMQGASQLVAKYLKPKQVVIYESTVYPGALEEECVPILEQGSKLRCNEDFFVGYSPERMNPGDKNRTVADIIKVTAGSTPEATDFVDALYKKIVPAGTHKVSSIKVAEAAKVIENTQRDLNIALVNELAIIFNKLNLDTQEILNAAATKWNFMPFNPGLVGGHCIGVDPYYLTHKAQAVGYHPEIILAGRRINDNMGKYVAEQVIKIMLSKKIHVLDADILILGYTFKENCSDVRNTRVGDIVDELTYCGAKVKVFDPYVHGEGNIPQGKYDAVIVAVAHNFFKEMGIKQIQNLGKDKHVVYDVKYAFSAQETDGRL